MCEGRGDKGRGRERGERGRDGVLRERESMEEREEVGGIKGWRNKEMRSMRRRE